jgi:hypothetical protein
MITRIHHKCCNPGFVSFVIYSLLFVSVPLFFIQPASATESVQFDVRHLRKAFIGQDLNFMVGIDGNVQNAHINIRPTDMLGEYLQIEMDTDDGKIFTGTLRLTQDPTFNWSSLEYFYSAVTPAGRKHNTRSYIVSFVEPPVVQSPQVLASKNLNSAEWNQLIMGRPIYKRAWFWVGLTAVAGITYLILKDDNGNGEEPEPLAWDGAPIIPDGEYNFGEEITVSAKVTGGRGNPEWTLTITLPESAENFPNKDQDCNGKDCFGWNWYQDNELDWENKTVTIDGTTIRTMSATTSSTPNFNITFWIGNQPGANLSGEYTVELKVADGTEVLSEKGSFELGSGLD